MNQEFKSDSRSRKASPIDEFASEKKRRQPLGRDRCITIEINSPRKHNLRESTRIFRSAINSCSTGIRVPFEYYLTTSNVTLPLHPLFSLLVLFHLLVDRIRHRFPFSTVSCAPSPSRRAEVLVPRFRNYPRLVESLISGVRVHEAGESDFW